MMRMPAEFAAHERTVMCWPTRAGVFGDRIADAKRAHASVARTISGFEPVTMIANAADVSDAAGQSGDAVEVVEIGRAHV